MAKIAIDHIVAWGHENVRAMHKSTIEITKDDYLTPRGDCIIGIKANKGLAELKEELKEILRKDTSIGIVVFLCDDIIDYVVGKGSSRLILSNPRKIIMRRSDYIDDATLIIRANKAARDLDRALIERLKAGSRLDVLVIGVDLE